MKTVTSQGNSYLWFPNQPAIIHRWQTLGLIVAPEEGNPDVLNYFRIFISANTKQKVEDFIGYQKKKIREYLKNSELNQLKEGQIGGIQVTVKKLAGQANVPPPPPVETNIYTKDQFINEVLAQAQKTGPDYLVRSGEITIGIDRVDMHTRPPYEIFYVIDPETKILSQNGRYSIQFSADAPSVSCEASRGRVNLSVYELTKEQSWSHKDTRNVVAGAGKQGVPNLQKEFTGNWQAEVTGAELQNEFTLSFSKVIFV